MLNFYVWKHNWITPELTKELFLPSEDCAPFVSSKGRNCKMKLRCRQELKEAESWRKKSRIRLLFFENPCYFVNQTSLRFSSILLFILRIFEWKILMNARWYSSQPNRLQEGRGKAFICLIRRLMIAYVWATVWSINHEVHFTVFCCVFRCNSTMVLALTEVQEQVVIAKTDPILCRD